jgi:hypothetical protein
MWSAQPQQQQQQQQEQASQQQQQQQVEAGPASDAASEAVLRAPYVLKVSKTCDTEFGR